MYKIQCYLLMLTLLNTYVTFSQQPQVFREVRPDQQATFTDHLLTDQVELGQKHAYNV